MIFALDPGKHIGLALVTPQGRLHSQRILSLADLQTLPIPSDYTIVLGNGTGSHQVQMCLQQRGCRVILVDERGTSLEARALYWHHQPARGWQRLLPQGLRVVSSLDGYAAYAIALRWLAQQASAP